MGREIKRVTEGFDWPLKKVWAGYQNPYWDLRRDCPVCSNRDRHGFSAYANHLYDLWYGDAPFQPEDNGSIPWKPTDLFIQQIIREKVERNRNDWLEMYRCDDAEEAILFESIRMCTHYNSAWQYHLSEQDILDLVEADCLWEFTRRPLSPEQETWPNGWTKEPTGYVPSREEVLEWHMGHGLFGMSGSEAYAIIRARCQRAGEPLECERCTGSGSIWESQAAQRLYDEWEETEPPEGEWWQVWETVSEGSPVSPAFATADELINWLIDEGYSEGAAEAFVTSDGWAPSFVLGNGRLYKDIDAMDIARQYDDEEPDDETGQADNDVSGAQVSFDIVYDQPVSTLFEQPTNIAGRVAAAGIVIFFLLVMLVQLI